MLEVQNEIRNVSVFIKIRPSEFKLLKRLSKKNKVSRTEYICQLIEKASKQNEQKK